MLYELHNCRNKKVMHAAMSYVINHLDIPDHVYVDIYFKSCSSMGGCIDMEDDGEYHYFEMEINNKQSLEEMVTTLFHEMKHVEQIITGRLDQTIWEGVSHKDTPYEDRPWEIEAYEFESRAILQYRT